MSGLAGLLAGHTPPGVYQWHTAFEPDDVAHTVRLADWGFGWLDGWTHHGRAAVLTQLGESLDFPAHYGANLDALADCLSDLTQPTLLLWDGWGNLAGTDGAAFAGMLEVFGERVESAPAFAVLLRGAGPPLDVPSVDGPGDSSYD